MINVRSTMSHDTGAIQKVLDGTGLFPSEILPEMISPFLSDPNSEEVWLTAEVDSSVVGFCYARPEQLAEGTWNMLAIAVLPTEQGSGVGSAITKELEASLRRGGNRILIADTSGTDEFSQTREFYSKNGYSEEARIRDFWAPGDDKIVYWKSL